MAAAKDGTPQEPPQKTPWIVDWRTTGKLLVHTIQYNTYVLMPAISTSMYRLHTSTDLCTNHKFNFISQILARLDVGIKDEGLENSPDCPPASKVVLPVAITKRNRKVAVRSLERQAETSVS